MSRSTYSAPMTSGLVGMAGVVAVDDVVSRVVGGVPDMEDDVVCPVEELVSSAVEVVPGVRPVHAARTIVTANQSPVLETVLEGAVLLPTGRISPG
ncbi:MAG: hypothetical protein L0Z47_04335 [Actinobacteria bacterium]|nr:hypothetical protein [Actinomycetota bacterium]